MSLKKEELFQALEGVEEKRLEHTERNAYRNSRSVWVKWGAACACICLLVVAAAAYPELFPKNKDGAVSDRKDDQASFQMSSNKADDGKESKTEDHSTDDTDSVQGEIADPAAPTDPTDSLDEQAEYGFSLNGAIYYPISIDDRERYGLVDDSDSIADDLADVEDIEMSKTDDAEIASDHAVTDSSDTSSWAASSLKEPVEKDLGEFMGIVQDCQDENLNGCKVYHYAAYPDDDAICILEKDGVYEFYCADGLAIPSEVGQKSDIFLNAYQMPDSVTEIEVQNADWETLLTITDSEVISSICGILSGKENIGLEENEKRYAALWKETYGNEKVYYDGESMVYEDSDSYDQAHELWGSGERIIWFTTKKGFHFYTLYEPQIKTFECYGFYPLSDEEVTEMEQLLKS